MPDKDTLRKAKRDKRQGKAASTQAGEFVREEIHHIREGKHGARSTRQAIAIGLSKARRAGVDLPPPEKGEVSEKTRKSAARAYERGHGAPPARKPTAKRKRATLRALRREPRARGVPSGAREAGAFCSCPTDGGATLGGGAEGGAHQRRRGAIDRCPKGGARAGETRRYLSGAYG